MSEAITMAWVLTLGIAPMLRLADHLDRMRVVGHLNGLMDFRLLLWAAIGTALTAAWFGR